MLTLLTAAIAPLKAHALITADDTLAYVAMPLAVSDVCAVRGVQTDQVASLAVLMDQAQVSPEGFIDVFRYAPVALVYSNGRRLKTYGDHLFIPRSYRRRGTGELLGHAADHVTRFAFFERALGSMNVARVLRTCAGFDERSSRSANVRWVR